MTALTADIIKLKTRPNGGRDAYEAGGTIFAGSLVGVGSNGLLFAWSDTAAYQFVGIALIGGLITEEIRVDTSGVYLREVDVASASQTDVGDYCWSETDNPEDIDVTPSVNVGPIGRIVRFHSGDSCDVQLLTPNEALGSVGGVGGMYCISMSYLMDTIANGDVLTDLVIPHAFKLHHMAFITDVLLSSGDAVTFDLEIGATAVTGGELILLAASGAARGAVKEGDAITAANVGAAGDTISVVASAVTDFATGSGTLQIFIQNLE